MKGSGREGHRGGKGVCCVVGREGGGERVPMGREEALRLYQSISKLLSTVVRL